MESLQRARRLRPPAARDSYAFENVLAVEVKGKVLRNEPAPSTASQANQETRMRQDMKKTPSRSASVNAPQPQGHAATATLVVKPLGTASAAEPMSIETPQSASQRPKDEALAAFVGGSTDRFNLTLVRQTLGTLWLQAGVPQDQMIGAAMDAISAFQPRDAVEGMLASLAVAHHNMAMECLTRAMLPERPAEAASRLRQDAVRSTRAMAEMAEAIDRRRGKGQQTVRVEHVTVQAGGQAIVGQVTPSRRTKGGGRCDRGND